MHLRLWVRDFWIFSKVFWKISNVHEKIYLIFLTFCQGVEYDHVSETNKKLKMGKLKLSKEINKYLKVVKVDVTKASLTHAMKKSKYF